MGEALLVVLLISGLLLTISAFTGISLLLGLAIRAIAPRINRMLLAFIASGVIPCSSALLLFGVLAATVDEEFRGPEVLGLAILFAIVAFLVVIVWSVTMFATYRFYRNR